MYYKPTVPQCPLAVTRLYTIHYFEYHKSFAFAGERHSFRELMYVDRGEIAVTANDRRFLLKQNQLTVFAPDEFHSLRADNKVAPNTIIVSFDCSAKELERLNGKVFFVNDYARSLLAGIVREAQKAYATNLNDPEYPKLIKNKKAPPGTDGFAGEQMISCYLQLLLIELLRGNGQAPKSSRSSIQRNDYESKFQAICSWIDDHMDRKFTVDDLSVECLTNKKTLESIFRSSCGMSVIAYCRKRKMEFAKRLLREDNMNVSQISEKLGFSSVHYFSRTFKAIENMTPTQYANSAKAIIDHSDRVRGE